MRRIALSLFLAAAGMKASVIYSFSGTGASPSEPVAFQLIEPTFLQVPLNGTPLVFPCFLLTSSTNCASTSPGIAFTDFNYGSPSFQQIITFNASNGASYNFNFNSFIVSAVGVYTTNGNTPNVGTLTVSETPEPATVLLALGGAAIICIRRRFYSVSPDASRNTRSVPG